MSQTRTSTETFLADLGIPDFATTNHELLTPTEKLLVKLLKTETTVDEITSYVSGLDKKTIDFSTLCYILDKAVKTGPNPDKALIGKLIAVLSLSPGSKNPELLLKQFIDKLGEENPNAAYTVCTTSKIFSQNPYFPDAHNVDSETETQSNLSDGLISGLKTANEDRLKQIVQNMSLINQRDLCLNVILSEDLGKNSLPALAAYLKYNKENFTDEQLLQISQLMNNRYEIDPLEIKHILTILSFIPHEKRKKVLDEIDNSVDATASQSTPFNHKHEELVERIIAEQHGGIIPQDWIKHKHTNSTSGYFQTACRFGNLRISLWKGEEYPITISLSGDQKRDSRYVSQDFTSRIFPEEIPKLPQIVQAIFEGRYAPVKQFYGMPAQIHDTVKLKEIFPCARASVKRKLRLSQASLIVQKAPNYSPSKTRNDPLDMMVQLMSHKSKGILEEGLFNRCVLAATSHSVEYMRTSIRYGETKGHSKFIKFMRNLLIRGDNRPYDRLKEILDQCKNQGKHTWRHKFLIALGQELKLAVTITEKVVVDYLEQMLNQMREHLFEHQPQAIPTQPTKSHENWDYALIKGKATFKRLNPSFMKKNFEFIVCDLAKRGGATAGLQIANLMERCGYSVLPTQVCKNILQSYAKTNDVWGWPELMKIFKGTDLSDIKAYKNISLNKQQHLYTLDFTLSFQTMREVTHSNTDLFAFLMSDPTEMELNKFIKNKYLETFENMPISKKVHHDKTHELYGKILAILEVPDRTSIERSIAILKLCKDALYESRWFRSVGKRGEFVIALLGEKSFPDHCPEPLEHLRRMCQKRIDTLEAARQPIKDLGEHPHIVNGIDYTQLKRAREKYDYTAIGEHVKMILTRIKTNTKTVGITSLGALPPGLVLKLATFQTGSCTPAVAKIAELLAERPIYHIKTPLEARDYIDFMVLSKGINPNISVQIQKPYCDHINSLSQQEPAERKRILAALTHHTVSEYANITRTQPQLTEALQVILFNAEKIGDTEFATQCMSKFIKKYHSVGHEALQAEHQQKLSDTISTVLKSMLKPGLIDSPIVFDMMHKLIQVSKMQNPKINLFQTIANLLTDHFVKGLHMRVQRKLFVLLRSAINENTPLNHTGPAIARAAALDYAAMGNDATSHDYFNLCFDKAKRKLATQHNADVHSLMNARNTHSMIGFFHNKTASMLLNFGQPRQRQDEWSQMKADMRSDKTNLRRQVIDDMVKHRGACQWLSAENYTEPKTNPSNMWDIAEKYSEVHLQPPGRGPQTATVFQRQSQGQGIYPTPPAPPSAAPVT